MSRVQFLADHDLNESIVSGVLRREPAISFEHVRDWRLERSRDDDVLKFAADAGFLVVSHDCNTMRSAAYERIRQGLPCAGLVLLSQKLPVIAAVEDLLLIWAASEAEEWQDTVWFLPL